MLTRLPHDASRRLRAVVAGEASLNDLVRRLGPSDRAGDQPGLGSAQSWDLVAPCGLVLGLLRYGEHRGHRVSADQPGPVEVYASEPDAEHVEVHVGELLTETSPWLPMPDAPLRFALVRQDDNGNRIEMRRFASQCAAEHQRDVFEARGHKQFYWVEPLGG